MTTTILASLRDPWPGYRVAAIGTSLIQHNHAATISSSSPKIRTWSRGPLSWAQVLSNGRFRFDAWYDATSYIGWENRGFMGLNAGNSGQSYAEIIARQSFLTDNIACDIILVDAGTNDINYETKEAIQTAREALATYFANRGKIVVLMPILARSTSTSWTPGSAARKKANWINRKTRDFAATTHGVYFFDWNDAWVDRDDSDGQPKTGYSSDGIHFTPLGGYFVGKALAGFLAGIIPDPYPRVFSPDDLYDATDNPLGNFLTNPFLIGTSGALSDATGEMADGMRLERSAGTSTAVASKEAAEKGGSKQVITITPAGSDSEFRFRTSSANTSHAHGGGWMQASCKVDVEGAGDALNYITLSIDDQASNGVECQGMWEHDDSGLLPWNFGEDWSGTIITPPAQLMADSTDVRWRVTMGVNGASSSTPVVKFSEVELRAVEDPRTALNYSAPATS